MDDLFSPVKTKQTVRIFISLKGKFAENRFKDDKPHVKVSVWKPKETANCQSTMTPIITLKHVIAIPISAGESFSDTYIATDHINIIQ